MSLLMRRRSGQTLDPLEDESLVSHRSPATAPSIPDNYDPSIRGHIVHDFNAPRLNRNFSYNNAYGSDQTQQEIARASPPKIDREHTPVFHEHFDDDTSYEESQAAIRAEQLANPGFLARNSVQLPPLGPSPPMPPVLPKEIPPVLPHATSPPPPVLPPPAQSPPPRPSFAATDSGSTVLSPVMEASDPMDASAEATPRKRQSTKTPPSSRSRATSITDPTFQSAGLPSRFTSRASRFSFQISGGTDSAQEAILEERHKQKAAEKASKEVCNSTNTIEDDYDDYGMDDYDMDGGFEEEIPMLGEEDEFEGLGDQSIDAGINNFDFSSLSIQPDLNYAMSPMNPMGQLQTPVDANGNPIGFAMSHEQLQQYQQRISPTQPDTSDYSNDRSPTEYQTDLQHASSEASKLQIDTYTQKTLGGNNKQSLGDVDLGDDMYFDDGLIGEQDENDAAEFDESVFDDPDGPLYDRKVKPPPAVEQLPPASSLPHPGFLSSETGYEADDDTMTRHLDPYEPSLAHKTSVTHQHTLPDFNNMEAYHSALADATTRAEAAGRFTRKASVDVGQPSSDPEETSFLSDSRPSLVPDDGRFSMEADGFPPEDDVFGMTSGFDDYDYSEYDSNLEDDPMIAAANAEALAFDDEGFYGQEFGFYASAVGDSPNAWGGFFGPSGVNRTVSGRNAVREPNLTPITERSEYSTRNSFISLNHFRDGQQPLQSPGLAQLARMSPYEWPEEEGMSIEALLKLRKGAFGGSGSSLPASTSNSPRNSSPMGMQFVPRLSSAAGNRMIEHTDSELESDESANIEDGYEGNGEDDEGLEDAVNAAYEDEDEDGSDDNIGAERPESPTLTSSDYNSLSSPDNRHTESMPPLPSAAQLQALHSMPSPSHVALPMSPDGLALKSPANMPLPMSPYGIPLASPFVASQRPTAPPSIDTSMSSPSATMSNSTGPRRPSMALVSPISNSSPITPGGTWRAGHSRKGSAADSVTYVRDHDEAGEGRWILERRRTAESGELELIGREIVEGGRI
jgi:hypothetical protein